MLVSICAYENLKLAKHLAAASHSYNAYPLTVNTVIF